MDEPDRSVLERFVQGDQAALEALDRRFSIEVHVWILRIVRDSVAAEERACSHGGPTMTEEETLRNLLRTALPPVIDRAPRNDLWSKVAHRRSAPSSWPWFDLGVAASVALALLLAPSWLWLLVYHL